MRNLQRMLFGEGGGKKNKKKGKSNREPLSATPAVPSDSATNDGEAIPDDSANPEQSMGEEIATPAEETKNVAKGHGRLAHTAYQNATDISVHFDALSAGDYCPTGCGGRLYFLKPGIFISITGNALATVNRYHLDKLRCALCGETLTASLPSAVSPKKYDDAFKAQLALQKYYVAVPFYRQENYQRLLGFPLPDATQFELVEDVANAAYPVIAALEKQAANGRLIQNDDTHVKILSVIQENKQQPDKERTGMYTTCLMAEADNRIIALYYTGIQHAGENLQTVLRHRALDRSPIIQMCDASSMNIPNAMQTILCHCLGHGFRKFRDLLDFFPGPCLTVIKALSAVFELDRQSNGMTEAERFSFHRQHSKPIMLELNRWLKAQLAGKKVEPNSSLGKAMRYLLTHWKKLRRFLVVPGAPIDNHLVERALKIPIRVRRTAMFYKTEHGARIGNILTSLIVTAAMAGENPFEYLVALQANKSQVCKNPNAWLPWYYRETLDKMPLPKAA
jgi:transposase